MLNVSLDELYFKWLSSLAFPNKQTRDKYSTVIYVLYNTPFRYILPLDENRAHDGLDMRWNFSCDSRIPFDTIVDSFRYKPCNLLEMLVALSNRMEKSMLSDTYHSDRTSSWFAVMFSNLGLFNHSNDRIDHSEVSYILDTFMDRRYNSDGTGGNIIVLLNSIRDLRQLEIWDQVCLYAEYLLTKKED